MTQNGSKWPKNDISEMSRFTRFARHKFSAARHLKLFCTPAVEEGGREEERDGWCAAGNETTKQGCAHHGAMKSRQHTTENYLKGDTGKDRVT